MPPKAPPRDGPRPKRTSPPWNPGAPGARARSLGGGTAAILTLAAVVALVASGTAGASSPLRLHRAPTLVWKNVTATSGSPPPLTEAGSAYDPVTHDVVLFGGLCPNTTAFAFCSSAGSNETWTYQNGSWTQLVVLHPNNVYGNAMAYDGGDGYVVTFGGTNGGGHYYNYTAYFVNGSWKWCPSSAPEPPARAFASMAYDPAIQRIVMGGGYDGTNRTDMWVYHACAWTQMPLTAANDPFKGPGARLAYDAHDHFLVALSGSGSPSGQTWIFQSHRWTHLHLATNPGARVGASLAYDARLGGIILFGGSGATTTFLFHAGAWTKLTVKGHPRARSMATMSFDPALREIVLYGGMSRGGSVPGETWVLR